MHFTGAPWLIRDNRENEERCSVMLGQLNLKTGMTVCDMGCGNGFYSLKMAKMFSLKKVRIMMASQTSCVGMSAA